LRITFVRIRTEIPVSVQGVHGISNLLFEYTLAGLIAKHRCREVHLNPEDSLGWRSAWNKVYVMYKLRI